MYIYMYMYRYINTFCEGKQINNSFHNCTRLTGNLP